MTSPYLPLLISAAVLCDAAVVLHVVLDELRRKRARVQKAIDMGADDADSGDDSDRGYHRLLEEAGMRSVVVGRQRIVLGDCVAGMRLLRPESVDVFVSSPPYNLGIKYGTYEDRKSADDYLDFMDAVARAMSRALKPDGSIFLNVGYSGKQPWTSHDVASVFREHFVLQNRIAWVKSISVGDDSYGQFKPLNSPRYLNSTFEDVYHFSKSGDVKIDKLAVGVPFVGKKNIARFGHKRDRRCRGNSWFVPYRTINNKKQRFFHPASYPEALPEMCIQLHGGKNLLVVDPFLGTGTTLVAAQHLGHRGVGFDVDRDYARVAVKRIRREAR